MTAVLVAAAIVGYLVILVGLFVMAAESDPAWPWLVAGLVWVIAGLAFVINSAAQEEDEGPCLRHETRYMLVNKVMTPYRVCVERGEWIKEKS